MRKDQLSSYHYDDHINSLFDDTQFVVVNGVKIFADIPFMDDSSDENDNTRVQSSFGTACFMNPTSVNLPDFYSPDRDAPMNADKLVDDDYSMYTSTTLSLGTSQSWTASFSGGGTEVNSYFGESVKLDDDKSQDHLKVSFNDSKKKKGKKNLKSRFAVKFRRSGSSEVVKEAESSAEETDTSRSARSKTRQRLFSTFARCWGRKRNDD